jgi:hypothetical protein
MLFYMGDKAYTVPKKMPGNVARTCCASTAGPGWWRRRRVDVRGSSSEPEALAALSACEGMTKDDLKSLMDKTTKLYAGDLDEYLGN